MGPLGAVATLRHLIRQRLEIDLRICNLLDGYILSDAHIQQVSKQIYICAAVSCHSETDARCAALFLYICCFSLARSVSIFVPVAATIHAFI